ncbi:carboxymuconolactone decarboxylase family protein [Bradyrhizobium sp. 141]|uniref:carboxymuconolactone decarboxylase family protein n=1 Tax=Bradyrhizobium sp. 141 TaxID=2782617 RepID=UPI001FFBBAD4|nr:carboxymuconolactone decarboxylase family protein [Bradyrhizobium sp. 141]MCK1716927.1 carboxymuconolactone decarboxylase family protein [Bradyrhizobium sp. 141]
MSIDSKTASRDATRIPLLRTDEMSPAQRQIYDQVVSGPRGQMIGPLRAAIHSPELAALWSEFGEFLRYRTCLPPRLNELAILVTARRWTSQVEWWVHARACATAGMPATVIEAIAAKRAPVFSDTADLEVYEFARTLQQSGQVEAEIYDEIQRRWKTRGVVELTAVIGYYTMVAMTLNAHRLPLPEGTEALPSENDLVALPAGRLGAAA